MDKPLCLIGILFMEIFKEIIGFENYLISNLGRVKSISRKIPCKKNSFRICKEKILKNKINKNGYLSIQMGKNGKQKLIHRLVALSFIPNPENKYSVNHINGIKNDNRVENLEWCTQSENQLHAYKIGLQKVSKHKRASGEKQGSSKLKKNDVIYIRKNYKKGMGISMSKQFNVSQTTILNIINNKIWND